MPAACEVEEPVDVCAQTLESLHLLLPVDVVQRCRFDAWQVEAGAHLPHHRQSVWFAERKRLQEDAVDETEDRRRRTHADAECQHGDRREDRSPHQCSYAEAHILTKGVEPCTDTHITDIVLELVDTTDLQSRGPARIVTRHALRNLVFNQQINVAVDLVGELALDPVPAQEVAREMAETRSHAFEERHHAPSTGRKARAIATEMRPQFAVSALSCRRPAVVNW